MSTPELAKSTESETFPTENPDAPAELPRKYRDNSIEAFRHGAVLDLRVRFAMDLLTHSPLLTQPMTATQSAERALDVASELLALAERRGLVENFKELEHDQHLKGHIRRQVAFQGEMGKQQMRAQREAGGVVQQLPGSRVN